MNNVFEIINSNENYNFDLFGLLEEKISQYQDIPLQLNFEDFKNELLKSSEILLLKEVLKKPFAGDLYSSADHSLIHANNVVLFSYYIALKEGLEKTDIATILEAAKYHDIGRTHDNDDDTHGFISAQKYFENLKSDNINLKETQFLMTAHSLERLEDVFSLAKKEFDLKDQRYLKKVIKMATIVRDADALDRTRFAIDIPYNDLKPKYLVNRCSKNLIEVAQKINNIEFYVKEKEK